MRPLIRAVVIASFSTLRSFTLDITLDSIFAIVTVEAWTSVEWRLRHFVAEPDHAHARTYLQQYEPMIRIAILGI
ncbi:hypothetical protein LshimejAT787_0601280 [Lyophyllum shimeji]|uniref:Uncharacterized protein n=1 Tax=Lyophyllum shimeji TaxID=47721 RepID=A0A9P3UQ78_LYOSH|nr:hypothetical protein LshimejAT787_0601280 [Lyophyllum shimeji]